ncbi:MAG: alkanesulfonate transporter substrate-binding subunit [Syntrophorhabdaceae bacterium PtaU1.Bin034]|jgi:TRAP transporter TAXI family solute receptor|nr:MAG: alkanesulfonate transporter substrate-binding subunit [Syntrophorhabdaceae bacterium PtaU1.Bin034]
MKRLILAILAIGLVFGISSAWAQKKVRISIATGGTGGVYYPYGGAIASVISKYVPGVEATAEVTAAAVDNIKLIASGDADLGYAYPDLAYDAIEGKGLFKNKLPIRMVGHLYVSYFHLVTLSNSNIKSVADLKGKKVSTGAPGSGTEVVAFRVLEAFGLSPDKDIKRDRLSVVESANALKDGKIDAFFWVGGLPTAAILDLAATPNISMRLVNTGDALPKIFQKYGQIYVKATIPKTAYPKMTGDVGVVGIPNVLVCNTKADPDLIYKVLKAMFDHKSDLVAVHSEAKDLTLDNAVIKTVVPYHPGAVKFFREKGAKM